MAKIIPFFPRPQQEEDEVSVHIVFAPLPRGRVALTGDYAAVMPMVQQLHGATFRRSITDTNGKHYPFGHVVSNLQALRLLDMMEDDGWHIDDRTRTIITNRCRGITKEIV